MSATQNYASTPRTAIGQLTAANTARDGTGTIVNVMTAGASGSRIDAISVVATGGTTAGMVRLFIFDGTNSRLDYELPVSAITPSAVQPSYAAYLTTANLANLLPIILPAGYSLRAATNNAETFNVIASGGDF